MKGYQQLCFQCVLLACCGVQAIKLPDPLLRDALRCGAKDPPIDDGTNIAAKHEIVKEEVLFSRWRSVTSRQVRFPDGRVVDFDVRT
jgi:hypothetical protein